VLNIAHRGASGTFPENTLSAFRAAIDAGVDMCELDVQLSRDGSVVVIHDETVERTTDGKGEVAELTIEELKRLDRIPLLIVDEVGYIPFDPAAANLMFMLVSRRYEKASLIVTSNKNFSLWGEIFGDDVVAAAMIDRLVHHAEIIALKGDSYRLKNHDLDARPTPRPTDAG